MPQDDGAPTVRRTVGSSAEPPKRLLWRAVPASNDAFSDVACTRLPDGTALAVCHDINGSLHLWDLATGTPYGLPIGRPGPKSHWGPWREVACTQLSDGTPVAVTGAGDGVLRVWELPAGRPAGCGARRRSASPRTRCARSRARGSPTAPRSR